MTPNATNLAATLPAFDTLASAATAETIDQSVAAWLARFGDGPDDALNDLLLGAVWLGGYATAEVPQALPQFFPTSREEQLDTAMQRWLAVQRGRDALPEGVTAKQFAQALADAFTLLQSMSLPRCLGWCREQARGLWSWLQSQPGYASYEPRTAFLRALALQQPNRDLLQFWISLCRQGQRTWVQLALFGLRRMPRDDAGAPDSSLPLAVVNGLTDYGLVLARGRDNPAHKKLWLAELDFLSAVYPMSRERWASRLREVLTVRSNTDSLRTLRRWVDERHAAANQPAPTRAGRLLLAPPHFDNDIRPLYDRYASDPDAVRPLLLAQMNRHVHFAKASGDSHSLALAHHQVARFLLEPARFTRASTLKGHELDAPWALELAQVSAVWAPGNPNSWSVIAKALDVLDDWARARAAFWYARRRFPYNVYSHTQLGDALVKRGQFNEGEEVYRAAVRRFPDNPVVWSGLAHGLRVAHRHNEALTAYDQAQQRFPRYPAIVTGLAAVFVDLRNVDSAGQALAWAEQVCDGGNEKDRQVLTALQQRYKALVAGRPMALKQLEPRKEADVGNWTTLESAAGISLRGLDALGEATMWRQRASVEASGHPERDFQRAHLALQAASDPLGHDVRWLAERGLWLAAHDGVSVARHFFDDLVARRPGDGVLTVLQMTCHAQLGEMVDWKHLRSRFAGLEPLLRVVDNPQVKRPSDLDAALVAVTSESGELQLDKLDDDQRQAIRLYETAGKSDLAELVQQDFLASTQLSVI